MSCKFCEKHSDWLIPVLCILVIFQAVMLFSSSARQTVTQVTNLSLFGNQVKPTLAPEPVAQIQLVSQSITVVKGAAFKVEIWLKPTKAITLGGADLVLKFDPKMATVSKIETSKVFSLVIPNRQSEKNGRLFITYLDESGNGLRVSEAVKLADLTLIAKQAGNLGLSVISNAEGATTVLADKVSSASLPFTAGSLMITVREK